MVDLLYISSLGLLYTHCCRLLNFAWARLSCTICFEYFSAPTSPYSSNLSGAIYYILLLLLFAQLQVLFLTFLLLDMCIIWMQFRAAKL